MALSELQKRQLEEKRFAEIGRKIAGDPYLEPQIAKQIGRNRTRPGINYGEPRFPEIRKIGGEKITDVGFRYDFPSSISGSTAGTQPETAEEETNRRLNQTLAMSEEQRKKKWEEARVAREAAFARGVQQNKPDTRSLREAEVAGKILPDLMPDEREQAEAGIARMNQAIQQNKRMALAGKNFEDPDSQGGSPMASGGLMNLQPQEQTDPEGFTQRLYGKESAQSGFDKALGEVQQEMLMSKYPGVGDLDGKTSSEIAQDLMSRYNTRMSRTTPGEMNLPPEKSQDAIAQGIMSRANTQRSRTTGGLENLDTRTSDQIKQGVLSELNTRGSRTTSDMGKLDETPSDYIAQNIMSRVNTDRSQTVPGMENLDSRSSEEMVRGLEENVAQRRVDAANIARQEKFDAENKAERERLFAGLDKQEKALAKEASGKYYVDPITGYAINLDKLKKHAKRQEVMAIAKELPAATKVKYLRNEGILDDEDIPKDQKLTLEKEKLRVEIAKIKAQTNEIKNKNPQAEMLVDMAGEAFEIGAYDAGFQLLQDAYGEPLPQNISKIFQSIKSKSSKKGGADDIDYTGHWFDPVKTGMPGKDYANRFYNTVRDVRQELTAIRENPLDETSVGKAVNLFAAHGIDYQEFIQRVKPGSLEYQDAFRKVVEKEVDARLGRPGIYNGVFSGLADDMAKEQAVLNQKQVEHDTGMTPEAEGLSFLQKNPEFIGGMSEEDDEYNISPAPDRPGQETTEIPKLLDDTVELPKNIGPMLNNPAARKVAEKILSTISNYQRIQANRKPTWVEQMTTEVKASNNEDLAIERDRLLEATKGGAPPNSDQAAYAQWIRDRDRIKAIGDELYKRNNKKNNKKRPSSNELQAATLDTLKNPSSGLAKTATHEDFSAKPYKDGDGYSIGHGFHLDKESITKADLQGSGVSDVVKKALLAGDHTNKNLKLTKPQSEKIFQNIYNRRRRETARTYPWVQDLPDEAKNVVYDMAFNLGRTKFKKFKGMLEALEQGDYKKAALHVKFIDGPKRGKLTPYWGQTKSRAEDNFDILMRL